MLTGNTGNRKLSQDRLHAKASTPAWLWRVLALDIKFWESRQRKSTHVTQHACSQLVQCKLRYPQFSQVRMSKLDSTVQASQASERTRQLQESRASKLLHLSEKVGEELSTAPASSLDQGGELPVEEQ